MFRVNLIKNNAQNRYNITPIVTDFSWDSEFTVTVCMEFNIVMSDTRFFPMNPCEVGDLVFLFKDNEEIYRGIIVEEQISGRDGAKYISYDFSWYLNQSTSIYQFNNITATVAISRVLSDFNIKIGNMLQMPTRVNGIYMIKTPGQIIQDIVGNVELKEGYEINAEMREGKIYFEKRSDLLIEGRFRLADNIKYEDILSAISDPKKNRSIVPMRNRIRLIVEDEETEYEVTAQKEDEDMIRKYGLLEETIKIDAEDAAKSRQVARMLLKRLSKVHETNEVSLFGDIRFKAGRLFDVFEPVTGINNRFMIVSAKHNVKNNLHTMDLELVLPDEVI